MVYFLYLAVAFLINIFFGLWRVNTDKFSLQWFGAIHLPIPFIIFLRFNFNLNPWIIPGGLLVAILGQIIGGKLYRWHRWGRS